MRRQSVLVLTLSAMTFVAHADVTIAAEECTCRFKGQDIPEGQIICADLPSGDVLMICDKVLNNSAWKTIQQGCPVTQAAPRPTHTTS